MPRKKARVGKSRTNERATVSAAFVHRFRGHEQVVENLQEMIAVVDRDYRYVTAIRAYMDYRGAKLEQIVGHSADEILSAGLFERIIKPKLDECFQNRVVKFQLSHESPRLGK
jgi:PAS domain-containing protein